ncbi:MAG: hypothetical protein KF830_16760 [Planctomycetes bacterium]|nr:hypothetical protein [Planctomycetota bacterium]
MPDDQPPADRRPRRSLAQAGQGLVFALGLAACTADRAPIEAPDRLADTGLYADPARRTLAADVLPFEPQYPLWTDGAAKRRWIALPPGTAIDASDVDHWQFPVGTRLWKEFTFEAGVETRFLQRRADGSWLYATYLRTGDGAEDRLAPQGGVRRFCATADGKHHDVPSLADCRTCHEGGLTPVLGFSALQLSADRDPLAPNAVAPTAAAVDLGALVARGLVRNLPAAHVAVPPRIAARTPAERAALGYLHGNCASCHNADGPLARLGLRLDYPLAVPGPAPALATTVAVASHFRRDGAGQRIAPGAPEASTLFLRLCADDPLAQMPPFGRHLVDRAAAQLVERWIRADLGAADEPSPNHLLTKKSN